MVIQHNLTAMNSNRMLGVTTSAQSKSTEKLSSGYKINRAADDAAGLSISEKMRKQIRGLSQASLNAQDGISAVQTAEGALNEVQDMLQRMNELAVKASNGSMSENDRSYIQDEVDALLTEIDRVAETTKFNETYLLKGNEEGTTSKVKVNAHDAGLAGKLKEAAAGTYTFTADGLQADGTFADGTKVEIAGKEYTIDAAASGSGTALSEVQDAIKAAEGTGATVAVTPAGGVATTYTYAAAVNYTETEVETAVTSAVTNGAAGDTITIDGTTYEYVGATKSVVDAQTAVGDAITSGAVGDEITIGDDTYTYQAEKLAAGAAANDKLDEVLTISGLSAANGDTITVTSGGVDTVYTYDGSNWKDAGSSNVTLNNISLTADTTITVTDADTPANTKTYAVIAGSTNQVAGFYKDGSTTALTSSDASIAAGADITIKSGATTTSFDVAAATAAAGFFNNGTALNVGTAVGTTSVVKINDASTPANNLEATVGGEKTPAGFYNGTTALDDDIAAGATVVITPNGGDAQTYTVADLSSGKINSVGALDLMKDELVKASSIGATTAATATVNATTGVITITQGEVDVKDSLSFGLHVGADADMTNKIRVNIDSMTAAGLGVTGLDVKDTTGMSATYAVDAIQDAIQKVSTQRSALGAVQNRLEHTIANLDNVVENTTAAESQIRDTDMATEMVKYSNNNILAQAGQAMLAQANQSNQGVLSLLG